MPRKAWQVLKYWHVAGERLPPAPQKGRAVSQRTHQHPQIKNQEHFLNNSELDILSRYVSCNRKHQMYSVSCVKNPYSQAFYLLEIHIYSTTTPD